MSYANFFKTSHKTAVFENKMYELIGDGHQLALGTEGPGTHQLVCWRAGIMGCHDSMVAAPVVTLKGVFWKGKEKKHSWGPIWPAKRTLWEQPI